MARMTPAEAVARFLQRMGTGRVYAYNGHANWGLLDALHHKTGIECIRTRHEIHAVHMADIEWRMRRALPIPVTCTTVGPGNFNTIPGIAEAFYDSTPMLCLMAGGATKWLGRGGIQEVYRYGEDEFLHIFKPIVKHAVMTIRPDTALASVMRAYKAAITGRPGPVVVYMPLDVQNTEAEIDIPDSASFVTSIHAPGPDLGAAEEIAERLARAQRPVIHVGTGIANSRAWEPLKALAEAADIPVATTFGGKGAIPEDHALSLGVVDRSGTGHGVKAAAEADLVFNIGGRFNDLNTAGWTMFDFGEKQSLIQVDIDPGEIGRAYPCALGLVSDAAKALDGILAAWRRKSLARDGAAWRGAIAGWKRDWLAEVAPLVTSPIAPMHYARLVRDASEVVNRVDPLTSLVCDTGFIMNFLPAFYELRHPWFATNNQQFGQMGFAPPGIAAAAMERPDHPVLAWVGDQSFIHTGLSLATATEYGLHGVLVVLNNKTIQAEVEGAKQKFGRGVADHYRIEATGELWNPDICDIARAMRAEAVKVSTPDAFAPALEFALRSRKLTVLDVDASHEVKRYAVPVVARHGTMPFPYDWNMH